MACSGGSLLPKTVNAHCDTWNVLLLLTKTSATYNSSGRPDHDHAIPLSFPTTPSTAKMMGNKKTTSTAKAASRAKPIAKPTTESDAEDSFPVIDHQRKMKMPGSQHGRASGAQRQSKKPAPQTRDKSIDANSDSYEVNEEANDEEDDDDSDPVEDEDAAQNNSAAQNNDEDDGSTASETESFMAERGNKGRQSVRKMTYEQAETEMLIHKIKLLVIDNMRKRYSNLDPSVAKTERYKQYMVRQLRKRLAELEKDQPADNASKTKGSDAKNKWWAMHGIIKESRKHYRVVWKGVDEHNQPWEDWWVPKRDVNESAKRDWRALRTLVAQKRQETLKKWEALEKARAEAGSQTSDQDQDDDQGQDQAEEDSDEQEGDEEDDAEE